MSRTCASSSAAAANNKRLTFDGYHSYRALEQIAAYANPRAYNHVVILKTPDGYFSRYFALVLEQALVDYVYNMFGPGALDPAKHARPQPSQCKL